MVQYPLEHAIKNRLYRLLADLDHVYLRFRLYELYPPWCPHESPRKMARPEGFFQQIASGIILIWMLRPKIQALQASP
jgi:hypothetical protein